jgi:intraflagellar transport protein 46
LVKSVENANPKAIDSWIKNISDLQKNKPVQIVNYQKFVFINCFFFIWFIMKAILSLYNRTMPDIEALMQQWPPEYEDLLKEVKPSIF